MAEKFDLGALLKGAVSESDTGEERIEYIDLSLIDGDESNFYTLSDIDQLAANIETVGLQQPLRVRTSESDPARVVILSGHRRKAALDKLAREGAERFRRAPCIREAGGDSLALRELKLIFANSDTRKLSSAELSRQAERVEALLARLKEEGYDFPGRMRDHVAEACKLSRTKLANLKVIREKLIPEAKRAWERGDVKEDAALKLARLPEDRQRKIAAAYKATHGGNLKWLYAGEVEAYAEKLKALDRLECGLYGGKCGNAEGKWAYSHAEGNSTTASNLCSHAEGEATTASGYRSHAEGYYTRALAHQHVQGHYNDISVTVAGSSSGTGNGTAFAIGNGTASAASNAFRVDYNGKPYAKSSLTTTGADYAEYFEWLDGNPENEDRRGYFVTLDGEYIKKAEPGDYILGIISGQPAIIGNGDESWMGRYIMDDFGAFIYVPYEYEEEEFDPETGETITVKKTCMTYKTNPDYDPEKGYIHREERPEWSAVGMMGVLTLRDDGTCEVNGYCQVAEGGIATKADTGWRVIKRVKENIVKVVFR